MPVPSSITDLSTTAGSNSPSGSESPITADDYLRTISAFVATLRDGKGQSAEATVASASTADIGAASSPFVQITGTTGITSFGTTYSGARYVRFAGALTLTHNATTLILPAATNITTAAGDTLVAVPTGNPGAGWRVVAYQRGSGEALVAPTSVPAANLTGTVAITNGGTGQSTALAGFDALKQSATDAYTGVVELATSAEAQAGADTTRAITPATLFGGLNASGSAPIYACRAWVNFNGTGTVAIRASGNVSSITDNGTGDYTVNFTTAMPDANYAFVGTAKGTNDNVLGANVTVVVQYNQTTTAVSLRINDGGTARDTANNGMAIFR